MRKTALLLVIPILLVTAIVQAKELPLPEPDAECGAIAATFRGRAPMGNKAPAVQVYFVRRAADVDIFAAEKVIPANFSRKKQVYLLNAKPGRYVAVGAVLRGGPGGGVFKVFFSKELISQTEVEVTAGTFVFVGDFLIDLKVKMNESDEAQAHYLRLLEPDLARKGYFARTFMGGYLYRGDFVSVERGAATESEFWNLAQDRIFAKEPAWAAIVEEKLESLS